MKRTLTLLVLSLPGLVAATCCGPQADCQAADTADTAYETARVRGVELGWRVRIPQ